MKKLFALLLAVLMLSACAVTVLADGESLGDLGWENDDGDFTGWQVVDEANFSVSYYDANTTRVWMENAITDLETFTVTLDMTASAYTSPYIKVMGIELELDGNNGSGNEVYPKLNQKTYEWYPANDCQCSITIYRESGGDVHFIVYGKDNSTPYVLSAAPVREHGKIELGLYRGTARFEKISVENGKVPEVTEPEITLPQETDPPKTEPQETKPTEPQATKPVADEPSDNEPVNPLVWAIIGVSVVAVVAIVLLLIPKKRKDA